MRIKKAPVLIENWQTRCEARSACVDLDDVGMVLWDYLLPVVEPDAEEVDGDTNEIGLLRLLQHLRLP